MDEDDARCSSKAFGNTRMGNNAELVFPYPREGEEVLQICPEEHSALL
jgi:hypothetical protein